MTMRNHNWARPIIFLILLLSRDTSAQAKPETRTVVVNSNSGEADVVRINNRTYIDIENLTRVAHGSMGFDGSRITLVFPSSTASLPAATHEKIGRAHV